MWAGGGTHGGGGDRSVEPSGMTDPRREKVHFDWTTKLISVFLYEKIHVSAGAAHLEEWRRAPQLKQGSPRNVEVPYNHHRSRLRCPVGMHFPVDGVTWGMREPLLEKWHQVRLEFQQVNNIFCQINDQFFSPCINFPTQTYLLRS